MAKDHKLAKESIPLMITLADGRKLYASPQDDTQGAFLDLLQNAQKVVRIADYSFNLPQFETALPELVKNGIDVKLVLDRSQSFGKTEKAVLASLQTAGVSIVIGTSSKHKIMHDKFAVIDDQCIYGSWNFTTSASAEDNFFVIDPNPLVANWFLGVWGQINNWIIANEPQS